MPAKKGANKANPIGLSYFSKFANNAKRTLLPYIPHFIRRVFSSAPKEKRKLKSRMHLYYTKKELDYVRLLLLCDNNVLSDEDQKKVNRYFKLLKSLSNVRRSDRIRLKNI